MRRLRRVGALLAATAFAIYTSAVLAAGTVYYTGQGFSNDGTTWSLNDQRCGQSGQGLANDGGTGQFGQNGFVLGDPYLVWVLTVNGATSATLYLPDGNGGVTPVNMFKVGGTFKYASAYFSPVDTIGKVYATWLGGPNKATLTVSHGCPPRTGGWCSPGFWRNATDAAWAQTGHAKSEFFNQTVVPNYYDTATSLLAPDGPTLIQVLTTQGSANTYGAASAPFGLNAFNATGAFLTGQLTGGFDPSKVGVEGSCQIDHFGNYAQ